MDDPQVGSMRVRLALDAMERKLQEEAQLAGLFSHRATIGASREFFVSRVLRSVLPEAVAIGHGQILGTNDWMSPEVDIIIHDSRFPSIQISDTSSVFFAESVIATVEVKSILNRTTLADALAKAALYSPTSLSVAPREFSRASQMLADAHGMELSSAEKYLYDQLGPRHFLFCYNSDLSLDDVTECVLSHIIEKKKFAVNPSQLFQILVVGNVVAWVVDDRTSLEIPDDIVSILRSSHEANLLPLFSSWLHPNGFGLLVFGIMRAVTERLRPGHGIYNVTYGSLEYFPAGLYLDEAMRGPARHIVMTVDRDGAVNSINILRAEAD